MYDLCPTHGMPFPCPKCDGGSKPKLEVDSQIENLETMNRLLRNEIAILEEKLDDCRQQRYELAKKLSVFDTTFMQNF